MSRLFAHLTGGFLGGLVIGAVVVAAAVWGEKHADVLDGWCGDD